MNYQKGIEELAKAKLLSSQPSLKLSRVVKSAPPANEVKIIIPQPGLSVELPILLYHTTPANFEQQLQTLANKGYTTITMDEASKILRGLSKAPPKPVVLTFDDGFSDQLKAFALLKKYNMRATFYIIIGGALSNWCVGTERQQGLNCGDSYLNWEELAQLNSSGLIEIGAHTLDHPQLTNLSPQAQREQIFNSKQILEQKLGIKVTSFAYPYGAYDQAVMNLVREAGFTSAVSTIAGTKQSHNTLFYLSRIRNTNVLP